MNIFENFGKRSNKLSAFENQADVISIQNIPENRNQLRKLLYKADCDLPVLDNWFREGNQDLIIKNFSGFFVFLRNGNKFTLVNVDGLVNMSIENAKKMNLVANNIAVNAR